MKIGQHDVWIGIGKGEQTPRKWWVVFTPLGREWISPECAGQPRGFWLPDVPRRFEAHGPRWHFMLALTPADRWAKGTKKDFQNGTYRLKWIELTRR